MAEVKVSYGNRVDSNETLNQTTLDEIIAQIKSPTFKTRITAIRACQDANEAKALKLMLPYFVMGVVEGSRSDKNVKESSGIVFDLDGISEPDELIAKLTDLDYIHCIFRSPRNGLKVIVLFDEPVIDQAVYRKIWQSIASVLESKTGFAPDNTPDPSRACFFSWDENPYLNQAFHPLQTCFFYSAQDSSAESRKPDWDMIIEDASQQDESGETAVNESPAELNDAISHLAQIQIDYRDWIRIGMALFNVLGNQGRELWNLFAENPYYQDSAGQLDYLWGKLQNYPQVKLNTIFYVARKAGWSGPYDTNNISYQAKQAASQREYPRLDTTRLPLYMQEMLDICNGVIDNIPEAKITTAIPTLLSLIGNKLYVMNRSSKLFCNCYALLLGASGCTLKTTTINLITNNLLHEHLSSLAGKSFKEINDTSIILKDTTHARLMELLTHKPDRLIIKNEIGSLLQEMKKNYNGSMLLELTRLYDGESQNIAKMEKDGYIKEPALSILGASTPEAFFDNLNPDILPIGFLQRFLYCHIPKPAKESRNFDPSPAVKEVDFLQSWAKHMAFLEHLPAQYMVRLHESAIEYYKKTLKEIYQAIDDEEDSDTRITFLDRIYGGYWFKFALLSYVMENLDSIRDAAGRDVLPNFFQKNQIEARHLEETQPLCEYYFQNCLLVVDKVTENPKLKDENKILECLNRFADGGNLERSNLLRKTKLSAFDFKRAMDSLIQKNLVQEETLKTDPRHNTTYFTRVN